MSLSLKNCKALTTCFYVYINFSNICKKSGYFITYKMADVEVKAPAKESTPASQEELTRKEKDVIRQIEYYFGDENLVRDKFLAEQIANDKEGWVPIDVLLTFKRLQAISEDGKFICDSLKKSDEGLVEVNEDSTKLRRHTERPLPEQNEVRRKEVMTRTAYVKGFPNTGLEMSDLIDFFNPHEKVVHIYMRKYHDKANKGTYLFKGSVFVTFAKREQCQEFLNKDKVEFKSVPLICKWQSDYLDDKKKERADKTNKRGKNKEAEKEKEKFQFPKNAVIHLDGLGADVTRETLKAEFGKLEKTAEIAFVDYSKGDQAGHIRFKEDDDAKKVFAGLEDGKLTINDKAVVCRVLEGDEEKEFLVKAGKDMAARRGGNFGKSGHHNRGRDGGKQGGGNRRSERKRKRGNDQGSDDEVPAKKEATANE